MKAAKTGFRPPYKKTSSGANLKVNIPHLRETKNQAGVYIIKSKKTDKIIYIGFSKTQLYKTLTRHFQTWNDSLQDRYVYNKNKYLVRVIYTTPARASILETYLIKKYMPRDNKDKLEIILSMQVQKKAENILNDTNFLKVTDDCPF